MKYFFDIGLDEINNEHLVGNWTIENRYINKNKHEEIFLNCNTLHFINYNEFNSPSCMTSVGEWSMIREIEVIYNPQLIFFYHEKQIGKAIITRLITDEIFYKLTLYFTSGLEIRMQKHINSAAS